MNKYEIMYILDTDLNEDGIHNEINKIQNILIDNGVEISKVVELGVKEFAYPIKNKKKGYYVVTNVKANSSLKDFSRLMRLDEKVIRFLIVEDSYVEKQKIENDKIKEEG